MKWDTTFIALSSLILASCNDDDLKHWLASTPISPPYTCPTAAPEPSTGPPGGTLDRPYFRPGKEARDAAEAGRPVSCIQDGPYSWRGTLWYVQRVNFVDANGQKHAAVRVCSPAAVEGNYGPALDLVVETPGGPQKLVGPNKCQLVSSY